MPCKSYKLESNCARRPAARLAQGEGAELPNSGVILTAQVGEWSARSDGYLARPDASRDGLWAYTYSEGITAFECQLRSSGSQKRPRTRCGAGLAGRG